MDKIRQRQSYAIQSYGFLTYKELNSFLKDAENDESLVDGYYERSTGWTNEREREAMNKSLANYIKSNI